MAKDAPVSRMDGSALTINIGTMLLIEPAGMGDRFKTDFLGMSRGQFLIVRTPRQPGLNDFLYVEKKLTVRYVHEGNVYGFESEIVWSQQAPYRLLFLRYPDSVEILNLRKCQRVDCYLPVKLGLEEGGQYVEYEGLIVNLSCGGCQLVLDGKQGTMPAVGMDAQVTLSFTMFGSDKKVRLEGKAKNINVNKNRMTMGVMYNEVPDDVQEGIENYVNNVVEYLQAP